MAMMRTLSGEWTLTDGILDALPIGGPKPVREALVDCGVLTGESADMKTCQAQEWMLNRRWTYETVFDAPQENDERAELVFEQLAGSGTIELNGMPLARFTAGEARVEITAALQDKNRLLVVFDRPEALFVSDPPILGLVGQVRLHTSNFVSVSTVRANGLLAEGERVLESKVDLIAFAAGYYTFDYLVTLRDEIVARASFEEQLRACGHALTHGIAIENAVQWDVLRPAETTYDLCLTITRSGVGCDVLRLQAAFIDAARTPRALRFDDVVHPYDKEKTEQAFALARRLGANTLIYESGSTPLIESKLLSKGFVCRAKNSKSVCLRAYAPSATLFTAEQWAYPSPGWRYLNDEKIDMDAILSTYGETIAADRTRLLAILRNRQADALRLVAAAARVAQTPALLDRFLSQRKTSVCSAIAEWDGAPRPAYGALLAAWSPIYSYIELSAENIIAPGRIARLPVWLVSDVDEMRPVTVSVTAYTMAGTVHVGTSFAALADRSSKLGEFALTTPDDTCMLILRVECENGPYRLRTDAALAVTDETNAPLRALLALPRAELRLENGTLRNAGSCAALGVYAPGPEKEDFYGALLPGESIAVDPSRIDSISSINGEKPHEK